MTAFEKAFEEVSALAKKFGDNYGYFARPEYQEAEVRKDFIDKFFIVLGWDVNHDHQHNPYEQEVRVEKAQRQQQSKAQKRADYAFYTAPNFKDVKFFTEAKKPAVELKHPDNYFQTIRYGWNANTPVAVLTDFEQLHIIDCRYKPDIRYVFNGQHKEYRYTDYTDKEKFAEIYWLFSREAVLDNSLQKYAEALPKPKGKAVQKTLFKGGYQAIDDSFLEYIDNIREELAKAFKKNDESLGSEALTEAVTRTVDRLVFIRFLEDKLIEPNNHVSEWRSWNDFIADCRKLDVKYNGVVFKEHMLLDKKGFAGAEEKMFLDICSDISNLNSPYDFNYIPIHILGSIYERFLGKVVVATEKRARIEEKPEVRKAGGVYYTPKYIVDYIVANTVGKIIEGKTPKQIDELRFADIACGSGSFLIGVYDCLLDYHKKYYTEKLKGKTELDGRSEDFGNTEYRDGQWALTLKRKQEILLNNIYGVDIDRQAVEVTQLSLFLKMLEDETLTSTQVRQGALFSKVLPDLSKNIICGNSLIGFDIMEGQLFENDELKKLNPMDFETAFPSIIRKGGFDAILGNPPYGALINKTQDSYFRNKYSTANYQLDTYTIFIERAFHFIKTKGEVGFIIPSAWVASTYDIKLRAFLAKQTSVNLITIAPKKTFKDATVETCLLFLSKEDSAEEIKIERWDTETKKAYNLKLSEILNHTNNIFPVYSDTLNLSIVNKIRNKKTRLMEKADVVWGVKVYEKGKGVPPQKGNENVSKKFHSSEKLKETHRPLIGGSEINRYCLNWKRGYIDYGKWLAAPRTPEWFHGERIVIREVTAKGVIQGTFINEDYVFSNSVDGVRLKHNSGIHISFLLGLINSKLISFYHSNTSANAFKGSFPKVLLQDLRELPIPDIDRTNINTHDQLVTLVTQMLEAKKQLAAAQTEGDKNFLENKCASLDRQIDNLVYKLYNLTEEEIRIVEGG